MEFCWEIFENYSNIKFHENSAKQNRVFPCGRRERHNEANSRTSQFCKTRLKVITEINMKKHSTFHAIFSESPRDETLHIPHDLQWISMWRNTPHSTRSSVNSHVTKHSKRYNMKENRICFQNIAGLIMRTTINY